jgi:cGMP-dependent protein kinase
LIYFYSNFLIISVFRWFEGFSWECLKKGTLAAPYVPKVRYSFVFNTSKFSFKIENDADTSNFDFFAEDDTPEPEDDLTGWDKDF